MSITMILTIFKDNGLEKWDMAMLEMVWSAIPAYFNNVYQNLVFIQEIAIELQHLNAIENKDAKTESVIIISCKKNIDQICKNIFNKRSHF